MSLDTQGVTPNTANCGNLGLAFFYSQSGFREVGAQLAAVTRMPRRRQQTVSAAAVDSRLALLRALRGKIAADIDTGDVHPRDMAALARRLMDLAKEIELLESADKGDDVSLAAVTPDDPWVG